MEISKKNILLSLLILMTYSFALNEWNVYEIRKQNPVNVSINNRSLVHGSTIFSADNQWYVSQMKNFMNGKGFTIDPEKYHYTVRRTPVYPLFYGVHYILFGEVKSYFFIRFTQILFHAMAVLALFFAALNFTKSRKVAILSGILYGFHPTPVSFLYFTLTESICPSLVCFLLYFLSRCNIYNRKKDWWLAGIFFALVSLCRPAVFFFGFPVLFMVIHLNRKDIRNLVYKSFSFGLGAALLFLPYIVRNYFVTNGEIIVLEKYYGDPMNYGMPNMELRKWISCWTNPADYASETISNIMQNAICCDSLITKEMIIDKQMSELPDRALLANKRENIRAAYLSLYDFYHARLTKADQRVTDSFETTCMSKMRKLRTDFIKVAPFQYYIVSPMLIIKSVILQSNSSTLAFLDNYKNSFPRLFLKSLLFFLNIFLFFSLLISSLREGKYREIYFTSLIFVLANFIYITFYLKYFEARYLVPMLPCLAVTGGIFIVELTEYIKKRLHF